MKHLFAATLAASVVAFQATPIRAQEPEPADAAQSAAPEFDAKMATIQFMNYMNYVVYTLSSYQNVFVIEEEYKNLSPGRLNLNRIPDETILGAIEKMLDTIHNMRAAEKDREWFKMEQDRNRQIQQQAILVGVLTGGNNGDAGLISKASEHKDSYVGAAKTIPNAASKALTNSTVSSIAKIGTKLAVEGSNPAGWAVMAVDIAGSAATAYASWQDLQKRLEFENKKNKFEYDTKKDDELHAQNKEQLRLQYNLVKGYDIEDRFRLSDENAKSLVEAVKSSDPKGVYARLRSMKKNQPAYEQFPMFWRHFAWFAFAAGDPEEALEACDHFDEINRHSLFRSDPMAAQVAMTRVSAMIALDAVDADAVRRALKTIKAYNYDGSDVDMAYFCASTYFSLLGDVKSAQEELDTLLAVVEDRTRGELRKYRDLFTEVKEDAPWAAPPMATDLFRCHALQKAITEETPDGNSRQNLESILERSTSSSVEKLFFMDPVRLSDMWEQGKADVVAVKVQREKKWNGDLFTADVPVSWFALGDFPVVIDLMQGEKVVETLEEEYKDRIVRKLDRATTSKSAVKLKWKCPAKKLKGVDSLVLRLPNKSWPVAIRYLPPAGVDISNADFEKDETEYIPVSVDFMGKPFEILNVAECADATLAAMNGTDIKRDSGVSLAEWTLLTGVAAFRQGMAKIRDAGGTSVVVSCRRDEIPLSTNDLVSVSKAGRDFSVAWTNVTDFAGTLDLAAAFYSETGALICSIGAEEEIANGSSGTTTLKWPDELSEVRAPAILVLSAKKSKSLMQTGTDAADKAKALGGKLGGKGKALAGKWLKRGGKDANASGEESDKEAK